MENKNSKDMVIAWLKDAYAMENGLEEALRIFAKEAEDFPHLQERIQEHANLTKDQAERLKIRLEELGEKSSTIKKVTGEAVGWMQAQGTKLAKDRVVKNAILGFAGEYFEIACYAAIKADTESIDDSETTALAESIMAEEQEMADWQEEHMPRLVQEFLEKNS